MSHDSSLYAVSVSVPRISHDHDLHGSHTKTLGGSKCSQVVVATLVLRESIDPIATFREEIGGRN